MGHWMLARRRLHRPARTGFDDKRLLISHANFWTSRAVPTRSVSRYDYLLVKER
jgi:hypothetical protein